MVQLKNLLAPAPQKFRFFKPFKLFEPFTGPRRGD
jgi:hypothetical protein